MNAAIVTTLGLLGLLGQCPCVSEYDPPRPDFVAVVEVAGPARIPRHGESLGREDCERDVVVLAANYGLPAGERLTLRTLRTHSLREVARVWFAYEPLRVFDTDHRLEDYSKCRLPEDCTGEPFVVSVENGRLVDWHWPESFAPPSRRRPIAPEASILVVRVDGQREGTFSLADFEIEFDQTVTILSNVTGENVAHGATLRLGQSATLPELANSRTRPQLRWLRVEPEHRQPRLAFLPEYTFGKTCLVYVDRDGRLLDWQFETEPDVDDPPDLSAIAAMGDRLQHTPIGTAVDAIAFVHHD